MMGRRTTRGLNTGVPFMAEKRIDPARALPNKRRELFCALYADKFWGRPADALLAAKFKPRAGQEEKSALRLLDDPEMAARVKHLREQKSELSVADPAWIKDHFVEIVKKAEKDSDRIRALTGLQKAIAPLSPKKRQGEGADAEQPELPLFEGGDDGV
jgi:hypothetical protein